MKDELKHTPTPWILSGPVKEGTLNILTGESSEMKFAGYGIRSVEPKMYGGGEIGIEKGLTKENAIFIVRAVNAHEALGNALALAIATIERLCKTPAQLDSCKGTFDVAQKALNIAQAERKGE